MTHPEADLQIQVADLLRLYQRQRHFVFCSIPNELMGKAKTKAGIAKMARFKRMGLRSGVSDLIIIRFGGAFLLELKTEDGKQSENQKRFQRDAIDAGASYAIAHNLDEAIDALKIWGIIP